MTIKIFRARVHNFHPHYQDTSYPLKIGDRPHIMDGYLYRPAISSYTGKPSSHPVKSYTPGQLSWRNL